MTINSQRAELGLPEYAEQPDFETIKLDAEASYYYEAAELAAVQRQHELVSIKAAKHNLLVARRNVQFDNASDIENRVYHFNTEFSRGSCHSCGEYLSRWARLDITKPVEIVITSPGGDAFHGMALFDQTVELRKQGLHVKMTVRGFAASMAAVYLQAADERVMGESSSLMVHKASISIEGTLDQVADYKQFVDITQERMVDIFTGRTGKTRRQVNGWLDRKDSSFGAQAALDAGLIDRIG